MSKALDSLTRSVEQRLTEIDTRDNQILTQLQILVERVNDLERKISTNDIERARAKHDLNKTVRNVK